MYTHTNTLTIEKTKNLVNTQHCNKLKTPNFWAKKAPGKCFVFTKRVFAEFRD